ncbi:hypothetical protein [Acinetobacter calcoaceticus]|uniref:hypothetical protein n=1 Tax=Acinetobacter calcoaceticus TaxID=471 RepID=UPI002276C137|nr:hypothetical protein [Acinetobacter calcoaceticus]GLG81877.1 hypothetical protein ACSO1_03990 [Acinetobacter calcoaceticus]
MKKIVLVLPLLISVSTFASEQSKKIDFEKITTKELSDLTNKCLDNDYAGNECKQLKQYQQEQREKGQKAAEQLLKHSH